MVEWINILFNTRCKKEYKGCTAFVQYAKLSVYWDAARIVVEVTGSGGRVFVGTAVRPKEAPVGAEQKPIGRTVPQQKPEKLPKTRRTF